MIRWQPGRRSGSVEHDDVRRSLEMLDEILAEYESDSGSTNGRSPTENGGHYPFSSDSARAQAPPPPPEEAARVIVSYLPRYQNGTEAPTTNDILIEDLPPPPQDQDLNADACNNNAYVTFEPSTLSTSDYATFDDLTSHQPKQTMTSHRSPSLKRLSSAPSDGRPLAVPTGSNRNQAPQQQQQQQQQQQHYIESRFPEFPEFQLRMSSKGNYRLDDELEEGSSSGSSSSGGSSVGYVDMTADDDDASSGTVVEDYHYQTTSYLDESGDSEDRSSEECSSVIEVPMASRSKVVLPPPPKGVADDDGGEACLSFVGPAGDVLPGAAAERPEDYVKVHPKKYFEDCPGDYRPQVYPLDVDDDDADVDLRHAHKGGTMFVLTGQLEGEGGGDFVEETLPPPPAFDNAAVDDEDDDIRGQRDDQDEQEDDDDDDSDRDSPALMDDADIFCDLTSTAAQAELQQVRQQQCAVGHLVNVGDEEDEVEDDDENEEDDMRLGSWEEELLNRRFCALQDELDYGYLVEEREDNDATPTNNNNNNNNGSRFEEVHKLYREGSLDGMDEQPPEFKPPPPPSSSGSVQLSDDDDEDDDDDTSNLNTLNNDVTTYTTTFGSSPSDASDDVEEDETHVRWKVLLPQGGRHLVFGTTILLVNRKAPPLALHDEDDDDDDSSVSQSSSAAAAQQQQPVARGITPATTTDRPEEKAAQQQEKGHERKPSAEILGLKKLPDVRSIVNSFNKKETDEKTSGATPPPHAGATERRMSQEYVSILRKELPLFTTPVRPPTASASAPSGALAMHALSKPSCYPPTATGKPRPPLVAPKSILSSGGGGGGGSSGGGRRHGSSMVPAPMPPLTLSYPTATASLRRRAREQASKMVDRSSRGSNAGGKQQPIRQFSVPLEPSILLPNRTNESESDVPMLLSYRVVNGDSLPPLPLVKGATLPRPSSHDSRKGGGGGGHRVAPDTSGHAVSGSPTTLTKKDLALRRTPPPPPPLSKGPPPKIFVEVQPSRSESSCTSSCSCLCMKHQSPCNSPVPPPMPSHKLAEIIKGDLKRSSSAPSHDTEAMMDDRNKMRAKGFNGQLKWPRRQQHSQQQQQQQQQPMAQHPPPTLSRASTSADKINNEPYDALIMEIQAAIQHRKADARDVKDDEGSDNGITMHNSPKMPALPSSPMTMERDKSLDRKGLFKGRLWRRGRSDEGK